VRGTSCSMRLRIELHIMLISPAETKVVCTQCTCELLLTKCYKALNVYVPRQSLSLSASSFHGGAVSVLTPFP
jgi:hypothetical protein